MRTLDVTGHRYGQCTVLGRLPKDMNPGGGSDWWAKCECDCGKLFVVRLRNLREGRVVSCGCYHRKRLVEAKTTHGMRHAKVYKAWCEMRARCQCTTNERYFDYGGRGIAVYEPWNEFVNFFSDMGHPPTSKHTLERMDVNLGYGPNNCIWATQKVQQNNRRNNLRLTLNGRTHTLAQWVEEFGQSYGRVHRRLGLGWKLEDALSESMK